MDNKFDEKMESVRKIIDFNYRIITFSLYNRKISQKYIKEIKKECLKISDLYKFDLDCSDIELLKQINEFSSIQQ